MQTHTNKYGLYHRNSMVGTNMYTRRAMGDMIMLYRDKTKACVVPEGNLDTLPHISGWVRTQLLGMICCLPHNMV